MKINRSKFLKKVAIGLTAVTALNKISSQNESKKSLPIKKVTIVGAGLSGIYSAYLLKNAGYEVTIIEAKNRLGGRILTITDEKTKFSAELGGEWIHENHKLIKSLCKELNLELKTESILKDTLFGDKLIESKSLKTNFETKEILKRVYSLYERMSDEKKQGLDKLDIYSFLKYQGVKKEELQLLEMKYSILFGESIRTISAEKAIEIFESQENGIPLQYKIANGSEALIQSLRTKLKDITFITADPVVLVDDTENSLKIKTKSGKEFLTDACILAIPPNQFDTIKFLPELSKERKLAILQLRMSRITKASIIYKATGTETLNEKINLQSDGLFQNIYSNGNKSQKKGGLTLVSSGDRSSAYALLSPDALNSFFKNNLDSIELFSGMKFEKLNMKVWQNEPFIEGATSVYSPGTYEVKPILKENHGRVFFAGEHLGNQNGTMEAALQSAIEAVNNI